MKGIVDIHCHILPGIDDGAKTMEQSINMLRQAYREGIRGIIATPHYHIGRTKSDKALCEKVIDLLREEVDRLGMNMELYLGMEIYYYSEAMEMLKENKIQTMADSRYILIEYDPSTDYQRIKQGVRDAVSSGYYPIIAHVERYSCLVLDDSKCEELVDSGSLLQVNASSITGDYGKDAMKFIKKLMKKELVSFVATDAHSDGRRCPKIAESFEYVRKKYGEDYAKLIYRDNPLSIINSKK
jgi:protein-tyrosine phosphatase